MLKNYFITAFRHWSVNKIFSLINVFGLAIGVASFFTIALYVYHEWSYDRYHKNGERIFRIVENLKVAEALLLQANSAPPMGPAFAREFPEVQNYVRFQQNPYTVRKDGKTFYERQGYLADSTVFDVFTFDMVKGNPKTALVAPQSLVLTESTAKKYFGETDPLGQALELDGIMHSVTGILADVPENSHFKFDLLVSFSSYSVMNKKEEEIGWYDNGFYTYLLLNHADDVETLRAKMPAFIEKFVGNMSRRYKMFYEDLPLQPLHDIYLETPRSVENGTRGSKSNLYILSFVAAFILIIACINYVNLTTAKATRRFKEVGLRKILGAERRALVGQFLGESVVVCLFSTALGVLIAWLLLPFSTNWLKLPFSFQNIDIGYPWMLIGTFGVVLGFLSGIYPALVMSDFHPLQILKNSSGSLKGRVGLRKVLVTGQFIASITLIAGAAFVVEQLQFMRNYKLGYDKETTLLIDYNWSPKISEHLEAVKQELLKIPTVVAVSASFGVPGEQIPNWDSGIETQPGKITGESLNVYLVDKDFLTNYSIKIIAGRNFSRDFPADDSTAFIVNEAAVKRFGWTPEMAIGKKASQREKRGTIIGVVKDFYYRSLHHEVEPLIIQVNHYWCKKLSIKIRPGDIPGTVIAIQNKWKTLADLPFDYSFLDQDYDRLYKSESQLSKLVIVFSVLAVLIAMMGLIGLTLFTAECRVKEIGIRKVLGSSAGDVVVLMAKEFVQLIIISFVVAVPLVSFLLNSWLENFTIHIELRAFTFVCAGLMVLGVACVVIVILTMRAALANPVQSLRSE